MENKKLLTAQEKLYNSPVKKIDKNLKNLLRTQKEIALAKRIDDELEI